MNVMRILVMFASEIDVPAREGHDAICGTSVEYFFFGENGEQVEPKISADGTFGMRRGKSFLDLSTIQKVSYIPGIYDGTFEMTVGSNGKPTLKLIDLDFVGKAKITLDAEPQKKEGK